jgi:hypothetical protein
MHFNLHSNGIAILPTSQVTITQAIAPPYGNKVIHITGGTVRESWYQGTIGYSIMLTGTYFLNGWIPMPLHAALVLIEHFTPILSGTGSWTLGAQHVANAPAHAILS